MHTYAFSRTHGKLAHALTRTRACLSHYCTRSISVFCLLSVHLSLTPPFLSAQRMRLEANTGGKGIKDYLIMPVQVRVLALLFSIFFSLCVSFTVWYTRLYIYICVCLCMCGYLLLC